MITWAQFCAILCCPPLPSRIVAKLSFLPPPCSYRFVGTHPLSLEYKEPFDPSETYVMFKHAGLRSVDVFRIRTRKGNMIAGVFLQIHNPSYTVLFSHGNAADIGRSIIEMADLAVKLCCNVYVYDYSGYGQSSGTPSEGNLYADIHASWDYLQTRFEVPADKIVLYGQSIGTAATIDLAAKVRPAGVILHSPLASGIRVLRPKIGMTWCCDPFQSIKKIRKVKVPIYFMHGEADEVIPVTHTYMLIDATDHAVSPLITEGGHDDIERHPDYFDSIVRFLKHLTVRRQSVQLHPI